MQEKQIQGDQHSFVGSWLDMNGLTQMTSARAMEILLAHEAEMKATAARAAMLAELENPHPGLRVEGEGPDGPFFATFLPDGDNAYWWFAISPSDRANGDWIGQRFAKPYLAALVSSGAAVVTGYEQEKPSKDDGIAAPVVVMTEEGE